MSNSLNWMRAIAVYFLFVLILCEGSHADRIPSWRESGNGKLPESLERRFDIIKQLGRAFNLHLKGGDRYRQSLPVASYLHAKKVQNEMGYRRESISSLIEQLQQSPTSTGLGPLGTYGRPIQSFLNDPSADRIQPGNSPHNKYPFLGLFDPMLKNDGQAESRSGLESPPEVFNTDESHLGQDNNGPQSENGQGQNFGRSNDMNDDNNNEESISHGNYDDGDFGNEYNNDNNNNNNEDKHLNSRDYPELEKAIRMKPTEMRDIQDFMKQSNDDESHSRNNVHQNSNENNNDNNNENNLEDQGGDNMESHSMQQKSRSSNKDTPWKSFWSQFYQTTSSQLGERDPVKNNMMKNSETTGTRRNMDDAEPDYEESGDGSEKHWKRNILPHQPFYIPKYFWIPALSKRTLPTPVKTGDKRTGVADNGPTQNNIPINSAPIVAINNGMVPILNQGGKETVGMMQSALRPITIPNGQLAAVSSLQIPESAKGSVRHMPGGSPLPEGIPLPAPNMPAQPPAVGSPAAAAIPGAGSQTPIGLPMGSSQGGKDFKGFVSVPVVEPVQMQANGVADLNMGSSVPQARSGQVLGGFSNVEANQLIGNGKSPEFEEISHPQHFVTADRYQDPGYNPHESEEFGPDDNSEGSDRRDGSDDDGPPGNEEDNREGGDGREDDRGGESEEHDEREGDKEWEGKDDGPEFNGVDDSSHESDGSNEIERMTNAIQHDNSIPQLPQGEGTPGEPAPDGPSMEDSPDGEPAQEDEPPPQEEGGPPEGPGPSDVSNIEEPSPGPEEGAPMLDGATGDRKDGVLKTAHSVTPSKNSKHTHHKHHRRRKIRHHAIHKASDIPERYVYTKEHVGFGPITVEARPENSALKDDDSD